MRRLIRAALAVSVLAGGMTVAVTAQPAQAVVTCEKFGTLSIQSGRYNVQNNVWGADTAQCVDTTNSGFTVTQANHNKPTNGAPASYPSVYFGCHYANCTAGSGLPVQASTSAFAGLNTSVSMTYPGSGTWDAAYDIWFDPTPRTDGQNTGAEIMIWLNRQGSIQPVGSRVASVSLAGGTWDVWFGNIGWNVVSYVRTSATTSMNFAVNTFYSDAINRGYAQRSWYLTSIQAGFEPWVGGAGLAVNSFSVTTGGSTTPPPPPPPPPGTCRVGYQPNTWPGGFTTNITITNTSTTTVNGWTLTFAFPGNQQISSNRWNADITQNGPNVTARNVGHNAVIPPGGNQSFGFQGTYSGSNAAPSAFTLNGTACAVG
ncbi:GH12 family glycosyl hydrolase domain-containing protein [Actinophytocola sp.]|uniref:GH12 family glycosyl hydrolase domain-containing protein n=1 Tax=Actinophytocola sp. TaxID=1872138 RepID=UPI002D7F16F2|nr:cellulose binding domain-containing protein [Actinophytocola sp.]HET9141528.1 cellulose binding domain-containing protein [Actinophytocola sp.]